jgi:hypothetical protein
MTSRTAAAVGGAIVAAKRRPGPAVIGAAVLMAAIAAISAVAPAFQPWTPAAAAEPPRLVCAGRLLGSDGRTDLGELERAAATHWDLSREDAVVLLERREVEWTADRRRIETVHRAVRIAADHVVEEYADLRIAYDSLRTDLEVLSLRTYRDGHWIESGPTARVETTADALDRAPDLSGIRERMLLHDGVGLPCVVETAWRVTDRRPFRDGVEGIFVFAQEDPVVRAEFSFAASAGTGLLEAGGGAPSPLSEQGAAGGAERRSVRMEFLAPAGTVSLDAAAYLPHVTWSTWSTWAALGASFRDEFDRALTLDAALRDSVRVQAAEGPTPAETARRLAAFVDRRVRLTECDEALQRPVPRRAARVHATGYGSAYDRAALAAALFREAGLSVEPLYRGRGFGAVDEGVPTLGRMQGVALMLREPADASRQPPDTLRDSPDMTREPPDALRGLPGVGGFLGIFEPGSSRIDFGTASLLGRTVWVPGRSGRPTVRGAADRETSRLRVGLDLVPATGDSSWSGEGFVEADGVFSPYGSMVGLGDEAKGRLEAITGSILEGATMGGYNVAVLQPSRVVAGMGVTVRSGKPDDLGRRKLVVGEPDGGVPALLPGDLHLSDPVRRAPVMLPAPLVQEVRVRLRLPADRVVRLPEPVRIKNSAGEFTVTVERTGDKVTIVRTLRLDAARYEAMAWPELRALLLADASERNGVVLYK